MAHDERDEGQDEQTTAETVRRRVVRHLRSLLIPASVIGLGACKEHSVVCDPMPPPSGTPTTTPETTSAPPPVVCDPMPAPSIVTTTTSAPVAPTTTTTRTATRHPVVCDPMPPPPPPPPRK